MRIKSCIAAVTTVLGMGVAMNASALPIMLEGAGGGALNPWALIANGGKNAVTPAVFGSFVTTRNYDLYSVGANFSIMNRAEIYYDHQYLGLPGAMSGDLGTNSIEQNIVGAKVQMYSGSGYIPSIAIGINGHFTNKYIPNALGAHASGADFYAAATGIYPVAGSNLLVDADLYVTKSNYMGLLGQGGPGHNNYHVEGGVSLGYFLAKDVVLGAEWRSFPTNNLTPDNGGGANFSQSDWYDGYIAYMPNPRLSIVGAFVSLGNVATLPNADNQNQNGFYLNLNASF